MMFVWWGVFNIGMTLVSAGLTWNAQQLTKEARRMREEMALKLEEINNHG